MKRAEWGKGPSKGRDEDIRIGEWLQGGPQGECRAGPGPRPPPPPSAALSGGDGGGKERNGARQLCQQNSSVDVLITYDHACSRVLNIY